MKKLLLILTSVLFLIGCSTSPTVPAQNNAYQNIINKQLVRENKIAALTTAHGSPWVYIGESVNNERYYLNVETVKTNENVFAFDMVRTQGSDQMVLSQTTQAWWKVVSPNNNYRQIQSNFYCSANAAKDTSAVEYSASGQYIRSPTVTASVNSVIPNTVFSKLYDLVCSLK